MKRLFTLLLCAIATVSCGGGDDDPDPTPVPEPEPVPTPVDTASAPEPTYPDAPELSFYKGADISWVTEMEARGKKFVNGAGQERECTALMKEAGFNSIRLRVWVNPTSQYNALDDVLVKARRAASLGLSLMIDFHYSDTWADPGHQYKPAAWSSLDRAALVEAIATHTTTVLMALKDEGIDVRWVQVGNEVRSGLLWDSNASTSGATWDATRSETDHTIVGRKNTDNFVAFLNAGCRAVRAVYPEAGIIIHCDHGQKWDDVNWIAGLVRSVDYDIFGVSLYPDRTTWSGDVADCSNNLSRLASTYGKDVMVCEVGMPVSPASTARQALSLLLERCRALPRCRGVFYWEPECPSSWNGYGLGAATESGGRIRLTEAIDAFAD